MTDEVMLSCPFCGNDGNGPIEDALHVAHTQNDWHPFYDCYCVQCDKCTATMGYSESSESAIAAWNMRAPTYRNEGYSRGIEDAAQVAEAVANRPVQGPEHGVWERAERATGKSLASRIRARITTPTGGKA